MDASLAQIRKHLATIIVIPDACMLEYGELCRRKGRGGNRQRNGLVESLLARKAHALVPGLDVAVIPNGIDTTYFKPMIRNIALTGSLNLFNGGRRGDAARVIGLCLLLICPPNIRSWMYLSSHLCGMDADLRMRLGRAACQTITNQFTPQAEVDGNLVVYRQLGLKV